MYIDYSIVGLEQPIVLKRCWMGDAPALLALGVASGAFWALGHICNSIYAWSEHLLLSALYLIAKRDRPALPAFWGLAHTQLSLFWPRLTSKGVDPVPK